MSSRFLPQILNDECRNPLAREEADEREMNEVQSISSSCDKLDLLGIENSSSAFGTNNLSLLGNNNNNNNNNIIGNNEDEASSTGSQPGRGLSAVFGLDFASSVATTPTVAVATSRPSPVASSPRNRTISDPMAVSLPAAAAAAGAGCSTPAPTLHLSINLNSTAAGSCSQGSPSGVANCSPSPTSGCGGLSNVGKQRFSPRRQVSYHPASPINRRSLSPLANAGHNGIKRKIHPAELSWSCLAGGQDFEPLNKFPRTSLSRGSTPERGFPTPTASPGLSPRGSSSSTASTQHTVSSGGGAGTTITTSAGLPSSALSAAGSLPSSPSTPQPPSPSALSGSGSGGNPFSRSDSPTTPASALLGGKFPSLPFQDAPPHRRHLSVISNISSSSADSSFSSLDESGGNAALNFAGFSAVPPSSSSQSSSSAIHFCMTPPSNGSPAPPQLPQQQAPLRSKVIDEDDDDAEIPAGKFTWPNDDNGNEVENAVRDRQNRGDESRDKVEESAESRDGDETVNAAPMETDAS